MGRFIQGMATMALLLVLTLFGLAYLQMNDDAAAHRSRFGNWTVTAEEDRFDGHRSASAVMVQGENRLGVLCTNGAAIGLAIKGPFTQGSWWNVQLRIAGNPVVGGTGRAMEAGLLLVPDMRQVAAQIAAAAPEAELAVRIDGRDAPPDYVFSAGRAADAMAEFAKSCPLN